MCLASALFVFQKNALNSVNSWLSVVEDLAPEVLILVCDHACDSGECVFGTTYSVVWMQHMQFFCKVWCKYAVAGVSKQEAQQWCLAHAFELVELNPQDLPDEDGERQNKVKSRLCT